MGMDMEAIFRNPGLLQALTSLDAGEFARLLATFEQEVQARRGRFNRFGQVEAESGGIQLRPGPESCRAAEYFGEHDSGHWQRFTVHLQL